MAWNTSSRRLRNDAQHFGRGGLLLERFGQIVGALMQVVEQARVLDGDDRLVGEGLDERNLLVREWPYLRATNLQDTDGDTLAH
jgi:hypothetical protein